MRTRTFIGVGLALGLLLVTALSVLAGGWATIQLNETPDTIRVEEPFTVEFTVWQHGDKPVHRIVWDGNKITEITPRIELRHLETRETLSYVAEPMKQNGRFAVEMTLPAEGRWSWSIAPEPLLLEGEMPVLTVQPAQSVRGGAVAASTTTTATPPPRLYALGVIIIAAVGGIGLLLIERRNKRTPATQ